jgi:alpha-beta hydrolase superfamily lysophospholipase
LVNVNGFYGGPPKLRWLRWVHAFLLFGAKFWRRWKAEFEYVEKMFKPEKIKVPVLLVCSTMDEVVGMDETVAFYQALETKKRMVQLERADHEITRQEWMKKLAESFFVWDKEILTRPL